MRLGVARRLASMGLRNRQVDLVVAQNASARQRTVPPYATRLPVRYNGSPAGSLGMLFDERPGGKTSAGGSLCLTDTVTNGQGLYAAVAATFSDGGFTYLLLSTDDVDIARGLQDCVRIDVPDGDGRSVEALQLFQRTRSRLIEAYGSEPGRYLREAQAAVRKDHLPVAWV